MVGASGLTPGWGTPSQPGVSPEAPTTDFLASPRARPLLPRQTSGLGAQHAFTREKGRELQGQWVKVQCRGYQPPPREVGPGRGAAGAGEEGAVCAAPFLWLGSLGAKPPFPLMASGAPAGLGDVFSECDTRPPTEDSKYIFYDPGRLSPVTFA